jgi:hypothetical protein
MKKIDKSALALLTVEWSMNGGGTWTCRGCNEPWTFDPTRHEKGCSVDAALIELGYPDRKSREAARRDIWRRENGL